MYMQALGIDPDSVETHQSLRDLALKRKVSGGKGLGMMGKFMTKIKPSIAEMTRREVLDEDDCEIRAVEDYRLVFDSAWKPGPAV